MVLSSILAELLKSTSSPCTVLSSTVVLTKDALEAL
jgi:hypothetical protein